MATFQASISQSTDDVYGQAAGNTTSTLIYQEGANVYGGYRFQNVTIPAGSTLIAATLSVYVHNANYDSPNIEFYCQAADDPGTFSADEDWFTGRSWTTNKATWNATDIGTGWKTTADFAAALQEVIDRGGWASGNAIVIGTKGLTGTSMRIRTWDYDSGASAPVLNVTYTPPAGGGKPHIYYAMMSGGGA